MKMTKFSKLQSAYLVTFLSKLLNIGKKVRSSQLIGKTILTPDALIQKKVCRNFFDTTSPGKQYPRRFRKNCREREKLASALSFLRYLYFTVPLGDWLEKKKQQL